MKKTIKYLGFGITSGVMLFVAISLIGYFISGPQVIISIADDYAMQVLYAALSGIVCASSSIVYTFESLTYKKQVLIHFVIGIFGYIIICMMAGWIPVTNDVNFMKYLIGAVVVFVFIWVGFYIYYYMEAKKINEKISNINQ